jgi:hypothetical protein
MKVMTNFEKVLAGLLVVTILVIGVTMLTVIIWVLMNILAFLFRYPAETITSIGIICLAIMVGRNIKK